MFKLQDKIWEECYKYLLGESEAITIEGWEPSEEFETKLVDITARYTAGITTVNKVASMIAEEMDCAVIEDTNDYVYDSKYVQDYQRRLQVPKSYSQLINIPPSSIYNCNFTTEQLSALNAIVEEKAYGLYDIMCSVKDKSTAYSHINGYIVQSIESLPKKLTYKRLAAYGAYLEDLENMLAMFLPTSLYEMHESVYKAVKDKITELPSMEDADIDDLFPGLSIESSFDEIREAAATGNIAYTCNTIIDNTDYEYVAELYAVPENSLFDFYHLDFVKENFDTIISKVRRGLGFSVFDLLLASEEQIMEWMQEVM